MKKNIENFIILVVSIIICSEVLIKNKLVVETVIYSFNIWKNSVFPSLFPFLIIGSILIDLKIPLFLGEITKKIMYKLFKISGNSSFIIILSMLSGFPSSAKYIKELLINNEINEHEATKLLTFTHFSNPLFILGTITLFLHSKEIGISILICHYVGNLFIGLLFRNYYISNYDDEKTSFKKAISKINCNASIGEIFRKSITSSINTLLLILGTICVFLILTSIINSNLDIPDFINVIINGFFEMTGGLSKLNILDISLNTKAMLAISFISFGGLSVHMQVLAIISDTKIKYFPYFIARILHAVISTFIFFIWKVL